MGSLAKFPKLAPKKIGSFWNQFSTSLYLLKIRYFCGFSKRGTAARSSIWGSTRSHCEVKTENGCSTGAKPILCFKATKWARLPGANRINRSWEETHPFFGGKNEPIFWGKKNEPIFLGPLNEPIFLGRPVYVVPLNILTTNAAMY